MLEYAFFRQPEILIMFSQFNAQQLQAVYYLDSPLLVLAGAGSGKTKVITGKIVHLLHNVGYAPHQIAAITFTNKAAQEMRERIASMVSNTVSGSLNICTFHALGLKIIRQEAAHLGLKKRFSILDSTDCSKILTELVQASGKEQIFHIQQQISLWKNALISPEQAILAAQNDWEKQAANAYASYNATLSAYHAVDFDDLIRLPCLLFQDNADIKYQWQMKLRYLLVDECQDTNACQYALLRHLTGNEARFTVVGDDDQSIYAWRGADIANLKKLQDDYKNLKIIKLEQNYRSTQRILRVANAVIAHNPKLFDKKLWSHYADGDFVQVLTCQDEQHEADTITNKIQHNRLIKNAKFSDFAVLYRGNHQARVFEEALRNARIPYRISGGQSFFDKAEIKDILAYMRLLTNPDDDQAFLRAATSPKRGIGESTMSKLNELARQFGQSLYDAARRQGALSVLPRYAQTAMEKWLAFIAHYRALAETKNAAHILQQMLDDIGYQRYLLDNNDGKSGEIRWQNVQDFVDWIARKSDEKNLFEITQNIALLNILDNQKQEEMDAVHLSTLHSAKGLEYPFVFLAGCEEGLFPHQDSIDEGNLDEERRLMYVGITRAKQTLTITHAIKRKRAGHWQFNEPSRFLDEMPSDDIQIFGRKNTTPIVSQTEGNARLDAIRQKLAGKMKS